MGYCQCFKNGSKVNHEWTNEQRRALVASGHYAERAGNEHIAGLVSEMLSPCPYKTTQSLTALMWQWR